MRALVVIGMVLASAPAMAGSPAGPVPLTDPRQWVTANDYPKDALIHDRKGMVKFDVSVDPVGKATECVVTQSSGHADLDKVSCDLMIQRARFHPATDAEGRPVAGRYSSKVNWTMDASPDVRSLAAIKPGSIVLSFIVELDGSATNCKVESPVGGLTGVSMSDPPCDRGPIVQPFVDAKGQPVRKRVTYTQTSAVDDVP